MICKNYKRGAEKNATIDCFAYRHVYVCVVKYVYVATIYGNRYTQMYP